MFEVPTRPVEKPFRCSVADIFKGTYIIYKCNTWHEWIKTNYRDTNKVIPKISMHTICDLNQPMQHRIQWILEFFTYEIKFLIFNKCC